ncbi:MAG TPA: hypothetical protein VF510_12445 [Ktedonobacterales bacterium]
MTTEPLAGCALGLSASDLSAWRDSAMDDAAKARLDMHLPGCTACRTRIEEYDNIALALRAIPTPEPLHGFGRNPRPLSTAPAERQTPAPSAIWHRREFGGLGAVAAIALLLLAFAQIFGRLGMQSPSVTATQSPTSQATATVATTTTPREATLPGFQFVPATSAWGSTGLVAHIASTQMDASENFIPSALLPDGSALVGQLYSPSQQVSARLALWTIATGKVTLLNAPSASQLFGGIMTDGRSIVYDSSNGLSVYDLSVGAAVRQIRLSADATGGPTFFDHGLYVRQMLNGGIITIDIATGRQSAFPDASVAMQHARLLAFSWPYLVYIPDPTATTLPGAMAVRDLATGQQGDLTPLAPLLPDLLSRLNDNQNPGVAVTDGALFVVTAPSADVNQLYELDAFMSAAPRLKPIARAESQYPLSIVLYGANARAIGMRVQGMMPSAYDRALGKAVEFAVPGVGGAQVIGHFVVAMGPLNAHVFNPWEVVIYDTNKLLGG